MKFIIKWLPRIAVASIVIFLIISAFAFFLRPGEPPSPDKAEWCVQTYTNDGFRLPSRYYYGEGIKYIDGEINPVLTGWWWSYDGENYHKHKGDKIFPFDEYGKVDVIRRK